MIRFSSLGDVVMTTAVAEALNRYAPEDHIYVLTRCTYSPVFDSDARISGVFTIKGNESPSQIVRMIGRKKFDVVIDLHGTLRSIAVSALITSPCKLRLNKHVIARRLMIWTRNRYRRRFDVLASCLQTLHPLGISGETLPKLAVDSAMLEAAGRLLPAELAGEQRGRVVGIAPGARHATKRWNEHTFARLADELLNRGDLPVFIGDENDTEVIGRIEDLMSGSARSLAGKIDLGDTIGVVSLLDGLVTNDSGPMHLAGALGVPFAAVFGPTHPDLGFTPGYPSGVIVCSNVPCSPCSLHGAAPCRMKRRICMDSITWEQVLRVLDEKMGA